MSPYCGPKHELSTGKNPRRRLSASRRLLGKSRGWLLSFGGALCGMGGGRLALELLDGETRFLDVGEMSPPPRKELVRERLIDSKASSGRELASRSFLEPSRTRYFISSYSPIIYNDTRLAGSFDPGVCWNGWESEERDIV